MTEYQESYLGNVVPLRLTQHFRTSSVHEEKNCFVDFYVSVPQSKVLNKIIDMNTESKVSCWH